MPQHKQESQRISKKTIDAVKARARIEDVVQQRGKVALTRSGGRLVGLCPFHEDKTPSLHVDPAENLWNCTPCRLAGKLQGGDGTAIGFVIKNGLTFRDAVKALADDLGIPIEYEDARSPNVTPGNDGGTRVVASYKYTDATGRVVGIKERLEHVPRRGKGKSFVWRHPDGTSGKPKPWTPTLYRLDEVAAAIREGQPVLVVEGEKCADACATRGFVATTCEETASWGTAHANLLRGARVLVLADNDKPGREHAAKVLRSLKGIATDARSLDLPGLGGNDDNKADVFDWFAAGHTADELLALIDAALVGQPANDNGDDGAYESWDALCAQAAMDLDAAMATGDAAAAKPRRFFATTGAELLEMEFPATPWLVRGVLVDHGLQVISAEAKSIKTWVTTEFAMAVASGTPAFGHFPTCVPPSRVALFQAEDQQRASRAKLRALGAARGLTREQLRDVASRLHFQNVTKINVRNPAHLVEIIASARALPEKPALIVVDPLIKVHNAKENDAPEMEEVTSALTAVSRVLGCAVHIAHHNAKANEATHGRRGGQRMRGSSSVHGAVDGGLYLDSPSGNRQTEWTCKAESEIKGARSAGGFTLTLRVLEDDEHGEALRAAWEVVTAAEAAKDKEQGDEAEVIDRVQRALIALAHPDPSRLHSVEDIRARAGKAKKAVEDALRVLQQDGDAERGTGGRGWRARLRPSDSTGLERTESAARGASDSGLSLRESGARVRSGPLSIGPGAQSDAHGRSPPCRAANDDRDAA